MARTERLQVKLSAEEMDLLKRAAQKNQMSVSDLARWSMLSAARGLLADDKKIFVSQMSATAEFIYERAKLQPPLLADLENYEELKKDDTKDDAD